MGRHRPRRARHPPVAGAGRLNPHEPPPFDGSRRLTGPNVYLSQCGAVLETQGPGADDPAAWARWRESVSLATEWLGWPAPAVRVRAHRGGAALAFSAPFDQLMTATEINEWAWLCSLCSALLHAPGHPASWDPDAARHTLQRMAAGERQPRLRQLVERAREQGVPVLLDDEQLTLGLGCRSRSHALDDLPEPGAVDWAALGRIPTALVTGSNGKTTSVRLLAALLRAHGLHTTHNCSDGLYLDGAAFELGDYSGPAGARGVLRHPQAEAAVLETARGGLLRRGLAFAEADAALVTNISADHFGEYGIDTLEDLAEVKLSIARGLRPGARLLLNADDPLLRVRGNAYEGPLGWFALDAGHATLAAARAAGHPTCGGRDGRLIWFDGHVDHDLGPLAAMPLSVEGRARYNLSNIAGAALLAGELGVPAATIAGVLARFGARHEDNPGRLQRWRFAGLDLLMDYAHNPEGLAGLLAIGRGLMGKGRLGLLLGQAGNRGDAEVRALAEVAAKARPDKIVLKDLDGYLRGRAEGEVAGLLRDTLLAQGVPAEAMETRLQEIDAVRAALTWARPGDVLVLPVHAPSARQSAIDLFTALERCGWQAGQPLPAG